MVSEHPDRDLRIRNRKSNRIQTVFSITLTSYCFWQVSALTPTLNRLKGKGERLKKRVPGFEGKEI